MPRFARFSRTTPEQRDRRLERYSVHGISKHIDPFPLGFGTLPEKLVYEALSRRNINFLYLNDIDVSIPEIELFKFFQADFIIPSAKIIIEVQGAFWHSKPDAIESDAYKFALYETAGWKPLAWWDFDILQNVNRLFDQSPELTSISRFDGTNRSGELAVEKRTKTDSSQGIRTLNKKRALRLLYKKKPVTLKSRKRKIYGQRTIN